MRKANGGQEGRGKEAKTGAFSILEGKAGAKIRKGRCKGAKNKKDKWSLSDIRKLEAHVKQFLKDRDFSAAHNQRLAQADSVLNLAYC